VNKPIVSNAFPIIKVVMPVDLAGVKWGFLSDALLRDIQPYGKLHWRAAEAWEPMRQKALADGVEFFKPTSSGDTYRSYQSQETAFRSRYQLAPIAGASTRTFEGKKWYLKKGLAQLAVPGTSQHNLGLAVDVHTASGDRLKWMQQNIVSFGWSWEVIPSEPWHIRLVTGDNPTEAVKNFWASQVA